MAAHERTWDDPAWRERDKPWARGCRWLQSWWREHELGLPAGAYEPGRPERLVASILPRDVDRGANFLTEDALRAAESRLAEGGHSGIINEDRLFRNLLSSQPLCFNLFGPFADDRANLLPWVRTIDHTAEKVDRVRFEWAPDRREHFGGGSAFDVFVEYRAGENRHFVGVECKYAEDLAASSIDVRDIYREFTRDSGLWLEDADRRLDVPRLRQFWLNTLLAQSMVTRGNEFNSGTVVVASCAADVAAREATALVRSELQQPTWLRWHSYEDVLDLLPVQPWTVQFRRRYLDFAPVAHLLDKDDPRLLPSRDVSIGGLRDLLAIGSRVTGDESILSQIVEAIEADRLSREPSLALEGLDARAAQLAIDLKTWRQAAYEVWDQISQ